jgi:hypothetical protein
LNVKYTNEFQNKDPKDKDTETIVFIGFSVKLPV